MRMGRIVAASPKSNNGFRRVKFMSVSCLEFLSPGEIPDQGAIQAHRSFKKGVVDAMGEAGLSVSVQEGVEGLEIGRADGIRICEELQIPFHIQKP
jgi:hypothetical protein